MQNPHRYQCRARCRGRGPGWGTGGWRKPGNCTHGRCHDETKLSQHEPHGPTSGTKLSQHEPRGPTSGTKLSLLARNGSIWHFFYMQGEFCTVLTTKRPSRENFVPNARQISSEPTQQHPGATGVKGAGGTGGPGRGAKGWPRHPRVTARPPPDKFRMQFPHDMNQRAL